MANYFRLLGKDLDSTAETDLITVSGSSNFIVGSIIICNQTSSTNADITLSVYDADQSTAFKILSAEQVNAGFSREVLSRPFIMETNDVLRVQASVSDVFNILVSYLDRDRN